jgi:hypothetical protein
VLVRLPVISGVVVMSCNRMLAARRQPSGDAHAELTISAVVNRILPPDELPGGLALGIDRRLGATADLELRRALPEPAAQREVASRPLDQLRALKLEGMADAFAELQSRDASALRVFSSVEVTGATDVGVRYRRPVRGGCGRLRSRLVFRIEVTEV